MDAIFEAFAEGVSNMVTFCLDMQEANAAPPEQIKAAGQEPDDVRGLTMKEARERAVEHAERLAIVEALADNRHNRTRAAKALGVSYRTLLRKIQRYDIDL